MLLPIFFQGKGFFLLAAGDLAALTEVAHFQDFLVSLAHVVADDDLELAALLDNAHNTIDRFHSRCVDFAFIFQDESQPRHAMGSLSMFSTPPMLSTIAFVMTA